jgi:hypothetical protein
MLIGVVRAVKGWILQRRQFPENQIANEGEQDFVARGFLTPSVSEINSAVLPDNRTRQERTIELSRLPAVIFDFSGPTTSRPISSKRELSWHRENE